MNALNIIEDNEATPNMDSSLGKAESHAQTIDDDDITVGFELNIKSSSVDKISLKV